MAFVTFPSPPDLKLKFEDMVLDGRSVNTNPYGVSNPHPGFGKDPNILNEFGHTKYPMWVNGQIANNEAEEKALRGDVVEAPKTEEAPKTGW
jgi:hypothetical protein